MSVNSLKGEIMKLHARHVQTESYSQDGLFVFSSWQEERPAFSGGTMSPRVIYISA